MKFGSVSKAAAVAAIALAAAGTASLAQARDNVYFSLGANLAPGVAVGVSNAPPVYYPPVTYVQPAPVYYEPAPVYVRPAPVYYGPSVVTYSAPIYYDYGPRGHWRHGHHHRGWR